MHQVDATAIAFDYTCGGHATSHMLRFAFDNVPFVDVRDPCVGVTQGTFTDVWDVRGERRICYWLVSWNAQFSGGSQQVCIDVPLDHTVPTLPTVQVTRGIRSAEVTLVDQSINETSFRLYSRLAQSGQAWALQHQWDSPLPDRSTGMTYHYTLTNLDEALTYEVKVEVYHDRAPVSAEVVLPSFKPLPPIPAGPKGLRTLSVSNNSVSIRWDESQYATAYRIYRSGPGGGAVSAIATISGTSYTSTGLESSKYYCFEVAALNETGEGDRYSNDCETTYANPPTQLVRTLMLFPTTNAATGQVFYRGGLGANGVLDFLELRAEDNGASFAGLITSKGVAYDNANNLEEEDCKFSVPGGTFVDADGTLQGAKLAAIYGSDHPFLREVTKYIGGCPVFTSAQTPPPNIKIVLHYTGYAP